MGEVKRILEDMDIHELKELCKVVLNAPSNEVEMSDYELNAAAEVYIKWVQLDGMEEAEILLKRFGGHISMDRYDEYRMRLMDKHYEWLRSMVQ